MKKKILPFLSAVIVALAAILMAPIFVQADTNNVTMSIAGAKEYYDEGDELLLNVALSSFPEDYDAVMILLSYDNTKLDYISASESNGAMVDTDGSQVSINRGGTGSALSAGPLAAITFKAKTGASGSGVIGLSSVMFEDSNTGDQTSGTYDGNITVQFTTPLQQISLSSDASNIGVGETANLTVAYIPSNTTDSKNVSFTSSDESVATVSDTGVVTGVGLGSATITATSAVSGIDPATITINVTSELRSIAITPAETEVKPGDTVNLSIEYTPSNATDKGTITWSSSDDTVATVSDAGVVTGVAYGTVTITAHNSLTGITDATATVTVARHIESVSINDGTTTYDAGDTVEVKRSETLSLSAEYTPTDTSDNTAVTWTSSDESVATVSNGVVTPVAGNKGTTTITASIAGVSTSVKVKVIVPVESIALPADFSLEPGAEQTLNVTFTPADADNQNVTWESSNTSVVSVDNGVVKALTPGESTITAKSAENDSITASVTITVPEIEVASVTIDKQDQTIIKGSELQLTANYSPANATNADTATWNSSDESIATVDASGKVIAVAGGTATITATIAGISGTTAIRVIVPLESITFEQNEIDLNKGDNTTVGVTIAPADTTDRNTVVYASQSPEIAAVDTRTGVITAVKPGDAVITVTKGDKIDYLTVHVKSPLTAIDVTNTLDLLKNQSKNLQVTYDPIDTTDSREISWTNSDDTVIAIETAGVGALKVTGLKEGTATLTAHSAVDGVADKTVTVTVTEIHTTGIAISGSADTLLKGKELALSVIFAPENTTDDKTIQWSSSDPTVATISNSGVVKALKAGETIIEAEVNGFSDSFELTVEEIALTGITLDISDSTIEVGGTAQISVNPVPENTTDEYTVTFSNSDESVATVDGNGTVTGLKAGTAVITAVTSTGAKAQVVVTVKEATVASPDTGIFTREQSAVMATSFGLAIITAGLYAIYRRSQARK